MKWVIFTLLLVCSHLNAEVINQNVDRTVDLKTHVAKITETVVLENAGTQPVGDFEYVVDKSIMGKLAHIEFKMGSEVLASTSTDSQDRVSYKVKLSKRVAAAATAKVVVVTKYSHAFKPFPAEITQEQKQFVLYEGNLYYFSPYATKNQKTIVTLPSSKLESTNPKPTYTSDGKLTYGPTPDKAAFDNTRMSVHFGNNKPFLVISQMDRLIEVSHWGNIAVEETYEVVHMGARLSGPFSRLDYQRMPGDNPSVKDFTTVLPASAKDVYYRDEIGNISTSNMRERDDAVELIIRPRFPLFGGWKTQYTIGYNVPSYQYLWVSGDTYALKMPFVDHVFDNQVVDDFKLRVILPEGSRVQDISVPFSVERQSDETVYTYLDTNDMGRPVVILTKENLVDSHIQNFQLDYTFPRLMLLREPLIMVGVLFLLCCAVMACVRVDFSIAVDEAGDAKMRAASHVSRAVELVRAREDLYGRYDDAVAQLKSSKNLASFGAEKKKLDAERKEGETELAKVLAVLKSEGAEDSDRVAELIKLGEQGMGYVTEGITNAEKLLSGKMSKGDYVAKLDGLDAKRLEVHDKAEKLLMAL